MQENFEIEAVSRDLQGKGASRRLRREGMVPGIIYGAGKSPQQVATKHNTLLQHLEHEAFYSHVLTVKVDGKAERVVLKDLQRHPSKPFVMHFDLLRVAEGEKLKMQVPLHFLNEETAPGVKAGGMVSHIMSDVEVSCEPKDLPEFIAVDVGGMELGDTIHLGQLELPEGVELVALSHDDDADQDISVVTVQAPRGAEESDEDDAAGEETVE